MSLSQHKSHNYTTVQMVCWLSSGSTSPCQMLALVQISLAAIFPFFSLQTDARKVCYMFCNIDCFKQFKIKTRAKQHWSVRHYSSVYITTNSGFYFNNQFSKYHKIRQHFNKFFLGCGCLLVKRTNVTSVYTPNHNVVSKTTPVCTAVCNANTHSEHFILINLDQSVTKQTTAI